MKTSFLITGAIGSFVKSEFETVYLQTIICKLPVANYFCNIFTCK